MSRASEMTDKMNAAPDKLEYLVGVIAEMQGKINVIDEYRKSVGAALGEMRDAKKAMADKQDSHVNEIQSVMVQTQSAMDAVFKGVNRAEDRINQMHSTTNVVIEYLYSLAGSAGVERADFEKVFVKLAGDLFEAALVHRKREMARIKLDQHQGRTPKPMAPYPAGAAAAVFKIVGESMHRAQSQMEKEDTDADRG